MKHAGIIIDLLLYIFLEFLLYYLDSDSWREAGEKERGGHAANPGCCSQDSALIFPNVRQRTPALIKAGLEKYKNNDGNKSKTLSYHPWKCLVVFYKCMRMLSINQIKELNKGDSKLQVCCSQLTTAKKQETHAWIHPLCGLQLKWMRDSISRWKCHVTVPLTGAQLLLIAPVPPSRLSWPWSRPPENEGALKF